MAQNITYDDQLPDVKDVSTEDLVSKGFELDSRMKRDKALLDPIKKELIERIGNYPDSEGVVIQGEGDTEARLSSVPETVFVEDVAKVHSIMGAAFWEVCTVPVKALKDYLTKVEIAQVCGTKYSSRRMTFKKTE